MDLCSISTIKYIQKVFGFKNAKSLGQNFLLNQSVISEMVAAAEVGPQDLVIEIGPGIGVLTHEIAKYAQHVIAIELDKSLLPVLDYTLGEYRNVQIINEDVLKVDMKKLISDAAKEKANVKIMGNLPYYITTPIITGILEGGVPADSITIMMQKEVAERIVSPPGSKIYGALSIAVQFYCDVDRVVEVPKENFFPAPKVDSEVLKLNILDEPSIETRDKDLFFKLVKAGFSQRRKTLSNSLLGTGIEKEKIRQALETSGIDPQRRAETLSLKEFATLADNLLDNSR